VEARPLDAMQLGIRNRRHQSDIALQRARHKFVVIAVASEKFSLNLFSACQSRAARASHSRRMW
jgi:hypothetical protein